MAASSALPACGLKRTVFPLPGREELVPAGILVSFHDHSDDGRPVVRLPKQARANRWVFEEDGIPIDDVAWATTLVDLPKEGFYELTSELWIGGGRKLPVGLLVQLGYTRQGQPAAFPGVLVSGSAIQFQKQGTLLTDLQAASLDRSTFKLLAVKPPAAEQPTLDAGDAPAEDGAN